jgi:hypothetical protein
VLVVLPILSQSDAQREELRVTVAAYTTATTAATAANAASTSTATDDACTIQQQQQCNPVFILTYDRFCEVREAALVYQ